MRINLVPTRTVGSDALFHSPAFVVGFSDARRGKPFRDEIDVKGPGKTIRSAQLAYERGRQFSIIWGGRSFNIPKMIAELKAVGPKGSNLIS